MVEMVETRRQTHSFFFTLSSEYDESRPALEY